MRRQKPGTETGQFTLQFTASAFPHRCRSFRAFCLGSGALAERLQIAAPQLSAALTRRITRFCCSGQPLPPAFRIPSEPQRQQRVLWPAPSCHPPSGFAVSGQSRASA